MPFGLKKEGGTYQQVMTANFGDMLHNCLEDYVGNTVVKSKEGFNHVNYLRKSSKDTGNID